jgi:iron complex outermembrane receptor protein
MHYYQAELRYDWPSGFYAGVNTQMASKVQVDYANSYPADAYALLGARLGWDSPKRDWQTWLDLRNLTNKRYAATVTPGYDDGGKDVARSTPGKGSGVCGGFVQLPLTVNAEPTIHHPCSGLVGAAPGDCA